MLDRCLESSGAKAEGWTLGRFKDALAELKAVELKIEQLSRRVLQEVPVPLAAALKKSGLGAALKLPEAF